MARGGYEGCLNPGGFEQGRIQDSKVVAVTGTELNGLPGKLQEVDGPRGAGQRGER